MTQNLNDINFSISSKQSSNPSWGTPKSFFNVMTSSLSNSQKQKCFEIMDSITKYNISKMFLQPVDPIRDECSDYFTIIKKPMDLGTVRKKLETDQYHTVEQWKEDVNLIWTNTVTYNGQKALISTLAKTLQGIFKSLTTYFSSDVESDWDGQYEFLKGQTLSLIKNGSKVLQTKQKKSQNNNPVQKPAIPRSASVQPKPLSSSTTQNVSNITNTTESGKMPTNSSTNYTMSQKEIIQLSKQIEKIEDINKQDQIIDLIKKLEPQYTNDSDEIEIDLYRFKPQTLFELRTLVNNL